MTRNFKTLDEQIKILGRRNLIIEDEDYAKEVLLHYNYYKVINATIKFFCKEEDPYLFEDGTTFDHVLAVHDFDKKVKQKMLSRILEIERLLRSIISYYFGKRHSERNAYFNPHNFNDQKNLVTTNIQSLKRTIENFQDEVNFNKSIAYYKKKYGHVPFWFLINFLSFGKVVNFYQTMQLPETFDVCDEFTNILRENIDLDEDDKITPREFESFIVNVKDIRNVCAHDNLILNYRSDNDVVYFEPIHKKYGIGKDQERDSVFDVYIIMQALLPKDQYSGLVQSIRTRVNRLRKMIDEKPFNKLMDSMGFPRDYGMEDDT